jgi:hypothetical protein
VGSHGLAEELEHESHGHQEEGGQEEHHDHEEHWPLGERLAERQALPQEPRPRGRVERKHHQPHATEQVERPATRGSLEPEHHDVEQHVDRSPDAVVASAGEPRRSAHLDLVDGTAAHPDDRREQAVLSRAQVEAARHVAADRLEPAHVPHGAAGDAPQHPVGERARDPPGHQPIAAAAPRARDERGAAVHPLHQHVDLLGQVLQVAVHHDDDRSPALLDSGKECGALSAVASHEDPAQRRPLLAESPDDLLRAVRRAVAHHDDLVRPPHRRKRRVGAPHELPDALLLVVHRSHHGDLGHGREGRRVHGATLSFPFIIRQCPG